MSISVFDSPEALGLNKARMDHLALFNFPLDGIRVLDLGCGVGHLSQFFVGRGAKVTAVDARQDNIDSLRVRYPNLRADVLDIERPLDSRPYGVVFCYGLLYHLQNPLAALVMMAKLTTDILLLESIVLDSPELLVKYEPEDQHIANQSITGMGCRPTRALIRTKLRELFPYVYIPKVQPDHPDFKWTPRPSKHSNTCNWVLVQTRCNCGFDAAHPEIPEWQRNGVNLRTVIFASRNRLAKVEEMGCYL
jgi:SAM-dependent methyltransferase